MCAAELQTLAFITQRVSFAAIITKMKTGGEMHSGYYFLTSDKFPKSMSYNQGRRQANMVSSFTHFLSIFSHVYSKQH